MSGREGRESETKRLSSRLERESSSKRSRRDGKPGTERISHNRNLDSVDREDHDQKHRRRLQDALPLEAPLESESKVAAGKELKKSIDGTADGTIRSSDPSDVPRSRSFFQHDERGSAGQGGRSSVHRDTIDHSLVGNRKDRSTDRNGRDRTTVYSFPQRDDRTRKDEKAWRHDGFFELESDTPTAARKKRPAFREKKMEPESGNTFGITATTESSRANRLERPLSGDSRRDERGDRPTRDLDRPERPFTGDRTLPHRGDTHRLGFISRERERFGGGSGGYRARDRFSERHGEGNEYHNRPNSYRAEKWKHDLYDEANRSPTPKNEEDQIAKVEALLAL